MDLEHSHWRLVGYLQKDRNVDNLDKDSDRFRLSRLAGRIVVSCTSVRLKLEDVRADDGLEAEPFRFAHVGGYCDK